MQTENKCNTVLITITYYVMYGLSNVRLIVIPTFQ